VTSPAIHRGAAAVAMPWKNGGGATRELARHPAEGDFDWRLSVAEVAESGPFSEFPGVDRIIVLLSGAGMDLAVQGGVDDGLVELRQPHGHHEFAGELAVSALLVDGPSTDLNLMVRRDCWSAEVVRHEGPGRADADVVLAYVVAGVAVLPDGRTAGVGDAVECMGAVEWTGDALLLLFALTQPMSSA
jgi:environmental stress-induced protein Ves